MISREELLTQLRAMPSSLNDACRTMEMATDFLDAMRAALIAKSSPDPYLADLEFANKANIEAARRLRRCITMAMGCLDAESENPDERLAWLRLSDGMKGREPRATLSSTDLCLDSK